MRLDSGSAARAACAASLALLLAACGADPGECTDPAHWRVVAGRAFERGDDSARQAEASQSGGGSAQVVGHRADARAAWQAAGRGYLNAFRLMDPVAAQRNPRALMAFRAARAFSKAACYLPTAPESDGLATGALFWFERAEALAPTLRQVQFERARLYDSEVAAARDLERARYCYQQYLAAVDQSDAIPDGERPRIDLARKRAQALARPTGQ